MLSLGLLSQIEYTNSSRISFPLYEGCLQMSEDHETLSLLIDSMGTPESSLVHYSNILFRVGQATA